MLLASLLPDLNLALAQSCPTPTVTLSASSGSPGDVLTIPGEGWLPGGTLTITATEPEQVDLLMGQVPDSGTWKADINVIRAPPGNYVFVFSENMDRCDLRATVPFTINGPMISLDLIEGPPGRPSRHGGNCSGERVDSWRPSQHSICRANDSNWQTDTVFHVTAEGSAPLSLILMGTSLLEPVPKLLETI